ncbi:MAG: hypothetical protein IJ011_01790 [Clostridia bacterium]|nr:hypothetical protein [Clostridia bacterium]
MKKYITPAIDLQGFESSDIITASITPLAFMGFKESSDYLGDDLDFSNIG